MLVFRVSTRTESGAPSAVPVPEVEQNDAAVPAVTESASTQAPTPEIDQKAAVVPAEPVPETEQNAVSAPAVTVVETESATTQAPVPEADTDDPESATADQLTTLADIAAVAEHPAPVLELEKDSGDDEDTAPIVAEERRGGNAKQLDEPVYPPLEAKVVEEPGNGASPVKVEGEIERALSSPQDMSTVMSPIAPVTTPGKEVITTASVVALIPPVDITGETTLSESESEIDDGGESSQSQTCRGVTKKGNRCKIKVRDGNPYCHNHKSQGGEESPPLPLEENEDEEEDDEGEEEEEEEEEKTVVSEDLPFELMFDHPTKGRRNVIDAYMSSIMKYFDGPLPSARTRILFNSVFGLFSGMITRKGNPLQFLSKANVISSSKDHLMANEKLMQYIAIKLRKSSTAEGILFINMKGWKRYDAILECMFGDIRIPCDEVQTKLASYGINTIVNSDRHPVRIMLVVSVIIKNVLACASQVYNEYAKKGRAFKLLTEKKKRTGKTRQLMTLIIGKTSLVSDNVPLMTENNESKTRMELFKIIINEYKSRDKKQRSDPFFELFCTPFDVKK